MTDIDRLIQEIQGMRRDFGRNDLSGSFESFLTNMDANFEKQMKNASDKESELAEQLKRATAAGAPKNVTDAIEKERQRYEKIFLGLDAQRQKDNGKFLKNKLKKYAIENLSGRSGYSVQNTGKAVAGFGDSLDKLGMSKIGGAFTKIGNGLISKAGPLGIALKVATVALDAFGQYLQHKAKQQEFQNQKEAIIHQRQLALTQSFGEEQQAIMGNTITKAQNEIAASSSLAVEGNGIVQNAQAAATEIGLKSLTDIAGGAFEAAAQGISLEASINKFQKHLETQGKIVAAKNELANTQLSLKQENIGAKNVVTRTNSNADLAMNAQQRSQETTNYGMSLAKGVASLTPVTGELANSFDNVIKGNQALANAKLNGLNQENKYQAQLSETRTNIRTTMEGTAADFRASAIETVANMENQIYDAKMDTWEREQKAWLSFTQGIFNSFQKAETAAYQMGRSLNFNEAQLDVYSRNLAATQVSVGQWGKTMEDMSKLQMSYQETTGVNKLLSDRDFNKSFANGILIGDDLVSQLNSGMEVFNTSVSDSNDMFYEMYRSVTKMGLSGKKYAKDLVNNLKLAEKHNFRGGVKGLMEMSKWAQNVRFNTSALEGMINKVQEGGLEGVIKQSAELQVLGGNFAMGSDPLAMAWESFNDPEAYAKRINGMLSGLGVFNSTTGDVEVKGANRMIMNQAAKSLGMNVEDLMKQIRQEGRVNQIKSFVGGRFDNDQLSAIANNAKYENGQWTVNTVNGTKNITELTADDVASLSGENNEGTVEENVQKILSTAETMKNAETTISSKLQNALWGTFKEDAKKMTDNINKHFEGNYETYIQNMNDSMKATMDHQQRIVDILSGKGGNDNMISTIKQTVDGLSKNVTGKIGETNKKLQTMLGRLESAFPDAHSDNGSLESFRKNRNTESWMRNTGTLGTDAFNVMNELYTNFDSYYDKMSEAEKWLVAHWDPDDDVTDAKVSKSHQKEIEALGNYGNFVTKLTSEKGKDFTEVFKQQLRWMSEGKDGKNAYSGSSFGESTADDGLISTNGALSKINDGLVVQNGVPTRIDNNDQVLAAKKDGPLDRMLDMVQPRPMQYNSYVRNNSIGNNDQVLAAKKDGPLEIKPISININGNIQLNGTNIDFTSQMQNDPNFKEALWKIISIEVSKRADNSGRVYDPLYNRIQAL